MALLLGAEATVQGNFIGTNPRGDDLGDVVEHVRDREVPYAEDDPAWFSVEVDGVMSEARRRIFVPTSALRAALEGYHAAGERLLYPVGTTLVGEQYLDGAHVETTAMEAVGDVVESRMYASFSREMSNSSVIGRMTDPVIIVDA